MTTFGWLHSFTGTLFEQPLRPMTRRSGTIFDEIKKILGPSDRDYFGH